MTEQEAKKRIEDHINIHFRAEPRAYYISLALNLAVSALEKQIPKKPKCTAPPFFVCSACGAPVGDWQKFCEHCGQAIDWEGYRNENQSRE